jgi:hypothetical protein
MNSDATVEDDNIEYGNLTILLDDTNNIEKNKFIKNIECEKDLLLTEVNKNKKNREERKNKQIAYILKHNKIIDLSSIIVDMLDDKDLKLLYDKIVFNNRSAFKKIMEFLFYNNNQ